MSQSIQVPPTARPLKVDALDILVFNAREALADFAAHEAHKILTQALAAHGEAAAILATGNSQIDFLKRLIALGGIDWSKITLFHMDEYLGLRSDHPATFQTYMRKRVESLVKPHAFHFIDGDCLLPFDECARYAGLLNRRIDLCCMGIGENGHLAFNDPPVARFDDEHWVKVLKLDDACKMQQVKEGHFPSLEAVPPYALSLTIPALCRASRLICLCPESRKAEAVKHALNEPVSTACPASFLRTQSHAILLLDEDSVKLSGR